MGGSTDRVIVVGGGILGMLTARTLAAEGRTVTLIERDKLGRGASRAAGGIMSPLAPWEVPEALTRLAAVSLPLLPTLAGELARDTGIDPQYRRSGVLFIDCQAVEAAVAWGEAHEAKVQVLSPEAVAGLEPAAGRPEGVSVHLPGLAQIRNPRLLDALARDVRYHGVTVLEEAGDARLEANDTGFTVHAGPHGKLHAPEVVVCAGAWSGRLVEALGVDLPVKPVRGQMLWYQLNNARIDRVLIRDGKYAVPRQEGVVLVGSTLEDVGFDTGTTEEARAQLEAAAALLVPILATTAVQGHWAGLRPGSPDGIPFIGAVPGVPGLWLNTGHYRNGVNLAPASAALLADLMAGRKPVVDPAAYDPGARMASGEARAYNASR